MKKEENKLQNKILKKQRQKMTLSFPIEKSFLLHDDKLDFA